MRKAFKNFECLPDTCISLIDFLQGGALLSSVSTPGYHFMVPFITSFKSVQVCK